MEQKDIDIFEILKGEEYGTELYTPICGRVWHSGMANDKDSAKAIWTEDGAGREHFFDKNGKIYKEGEVLLFPSNEMRDWSKFFKKGDVLVHRDDDIHVIFEGFKDNRYTMFKSKHFLWKECFEDYSKEQSEMVTFSFRKVSDDEAQTYINTIEKFFGGKLNRETLEIEKPQSEFKDGDIVVENEVELFNKHYAIWKKEKEAKEQPAFKTFDKVLVRLGKEFKWLPAFFIRDRGESFTNRYNVLPIHSGKPADFTHCIPFEGHENIAFTRYDIEDLPF